ncbi:hypothetical protein ABH915_002101 [Arthrobacter sp. MW3 TE3886]
MAVTVAVRVPVTGAPMTPVKAMNNASSQAVRGERIGSSSPSKKGPYCTVEAHSDS